MFVAGVAVVAGLGDEGAVLAVDLAALAEGIVAEAFDDGAGFVGDGVDGAEVVFVEVARGGAGAVALFW